MDKRLAVDFDGTIAGPYARLSEQGELEPLSARQIRADGYGGVDLDHYQGSGAVEPDHVGLPGTAIPHEPRKPQMPAKRRRWKLSPKS